MTRKEAIASKSKIYQGKICSSCQSRDRYVTSCGCVACTIKNSNNDPEYLKEWSKRPGPRARQRRYRLKQQYNLTVEEINRMREEQNFSCAICSTHEDKVMKSKLFVDHCHTTNKVRGLLCHHCNFALGLFKDNKEYLKKAQEYLE